MRFMMLMTPKSYTLPDPEMIAAMGKYNESLQKAGILLALDGLHPPSVGTRVSFPGKRATVTEGPFGDVQEGLCGYWMIQVRSKEEAVEWAKRCPAAEGDVLEIRQVLEVSDFPPELRKAGGF